MRNPLPPWPRRGVICPSRGERVHADERPDAPVIDITGRYDAYVTNSRKINDYTLVINQAGRHIECFGANVARPDNRSTRVYYRMQGELQDNRTFILFERTSPYMRSKLIPKRGGRSIGWRYKVSIGYKTVYFTRVSREPVFFESTVALFPGKQEELVRRRMLYPLTLGQLKHLLDSLTAAELGPPLKRYFRTEYGKKTWQRIGIVKAARKVDRFIGDIFQNKRRGIQPPSNLELARFYARYILTLRRWEFARTRRPLIGWIQYMLNLVAAVAPDRDFPNIERYLGLSGQPEAVKANKQHKYKVKLSVRKFGLFIVHYSGKITIERISRPLWTPNRKETYNVVFWAGGVDKGLGGKMTIEGEAESYFDWQPAHIPGPFKIGQMELEIGAGGIGGKGGAGFMHIEGAEFMPVLHVTFAEGEVGGGAVSSSAGSRDSRARSKPSTCP